MVARADAHRARRGPRSCRRAGQRRGRLPGQAVRPRRAAGTPTRVGAARAPRAPGHPPLRPAALGPGAAGGSLRRQADQAIGARIRAARGVHAPAWRRALAARADRSSMGHRLYEPLQRRRRVRAPPTGEARRARRRADRNAARRRLPAARRRAMSRLPIRLRVAAGFAVAMAVVLAGTGVFLYTRLSEDLGAALDQQLQLRVQDLSELAGDPRGSLSEEHTRRFTETGESFAQLLGADGRVLDATAALRATPLLDARQRARALRLPLYASLPRLPNLDEGVRLLATPVQRAGRPVVLVVGATAE